MASSVPTFYTTFLFLCFALLLFSTSEVEAQFCERRSSTDPGTGSCVVLGEGSCQSVCINTDKADFGRCLRRGSGYACFCFFGC